MDIDIAKKLNAITSAFYQAEHSSFSETRGGKWAGWDACMRAIFIDGMAGDEPIEVLDFACGNLRFERYLAQRFPDLCFSVHAIDNCDALVEDGSFDFPVSFSHLDFIDVLLGERDLLGELDCTERDICVAFGIMHHIPGSAARIEALRALLGKVKPGGCLIASFWDFASEESSREKAEHETGAALSELGISREDLDDGDFILGWQGRSGIYRYCHAFTESDVVAIARELEPEASIVDIFKADGEKRFNWYLILRKL